MLFKRARGKLFSPKTVVAEAFFYWSGKFIPSIFIAHFVLKEQCY